MLQIPVKLDLDAGAAESALKELEKGANEALAEIIKLDGKRINIDFAFSSSGDPVVKELSDTEAELKRVETAYNKLTGGQEKSIGRTKSIIRQFKKQRNEANVNSKEFKTLSINIEKFENKLRSLKGVQKGSINDIKAQRQKLVELQNSVALNTPEFKNLQKQISGFDRQLKNATKNTNSFVTVFSKIAVVSAGIQALGGALRSVGNAVSIYTSRIKDVEAFNLALQNSGAEQAEVNRIFDQALKTSTALGAPLAQVEKTYKRMIPVLRAIGTSANDSDKFIANISARTQTLGLNTEQSGRLLEAFAQVLSKGKLQAEELNQQISELDGAFRVQFADALGVSVSALNDLVTAGQITASVFVGAVNKMQSGVEELEKRIKEGTATFQQMQNAITNIDTKNIETIGKAIEPALKSFAAIRLVFAEFIRDFSKTEGFEAFVIVFNGVAKGAELFAKALSKVVLFINKLISPVAVISNAILGMGEEFGGLTGLLTAATLSIAAFIGTVKGIAALKAGIIALTVAFKGLASSISLTGAASAASSKSLVSMGHDTEMAGKAAGGAALNLKALAAAAARLAVFAGITFIVSKMVESFQASSKGAREMKDALGSVNSDFAFELENATEASKQFEKNLGSTTKSLEEVSRSTEQAGNTARGFGVALGAVAIAGALALTFFTGGAGLPALIAATAATAGTAAVAVNQLSKSNELLRKSGKGKAFLEDIQEFDKLLSQAEKNAKKLGSQVGQLDFSNIAGGAEDVAKLSRNYKLTAGAIKEKIASLKAALQAEAAAEKQTEGLTERLKLQIQEYSKQLIVVQRQAEAASRLTVEYIKQGNAAAGVVASTDELKRATSELNDEIDVAKLEASTEAIRRLGRESNAAQLLSAANIGLDVEASSQRQAAFENELEMLRAKEKTSADFGQKERDRIRELTTLVAKETQVQAQLGLDARNAVLEAFEKGLQEANQKVDILQSSSSKLRASFDGVAGGFSNNLSAGVGLIKEIVNTEIQGLEVGSAKRKELIRTQLQAQIVASEAENRIAQLRLAVQNKIAVSEANIAKIRLQNEAAIAQAQGKSGIAEAFRQAAGAQEIILQGLNAQFKIESEVLRINKATEREKIVQLGLSEKLGKSGDEVAGILGIQRTRLRQATTSLNNMINSSDQFSTNMGNAATNSQLTSEAAAATSFADAREQMKGVKTEVGNVKDASIELGTSMQDNVAAFDNVAGRSERIAGFIENANTGARDLIKIMNSAGAGGNARALGGPVTGGKQYTVNDGGGREGFLSSSGKFSLLPAARNIQWTAPSSGMVVPARLVKAMEKSANNGAVISKTRSMQNPRPSVTASSIAGSDSGNLAKQLSTVMSGSTSNRITNNVTIQSESPVRDASDLLTNVARMRLRNGRRL